MKAIRDLRMVQRTPATRAPAPVVVILGNSTVRLVLTAGRRLLTAQQVEVPTGVYVKKGAAGLPRAARWLLSTPGRKLVVCSVQREALARLRAGARKAGQTVAVYGEDFGPGLAVCLPAAAARQAGRDRLAACAGAVAAGLAGPQGALVCDVGTALTINYLSPRGFEGGLIAPGVQLGLRALHAGTSLLPALAVRGIRGLRFPAKNTAAAMRVGCLMAVAGAIEKVHAKAAVEAAARRGRRVGNRPAKRAGSVASLPLILTGGSAIMIRPFLGLPALIRPHLVATGVWAVFCRKPC